LNEIEINKTLNELWTRVSSRSKTRHFFFPASPIGFKRTVRGRVEGGRVLFGCMGVGDVVLGFIQQNHDRRRDMNEVDPCFSALWWAIWAAKTWLRFYKDFVFWKLMN